MRSFTWHRFQIRVWYTKNWRLYGNPFVTRKNQLGFSPKFNHRIVASQGFQIQNFWAISLFVSKILVLRFLLKVHKLKILIPPFLQRLKSSSSGIRICLNFFISHAIKKIFKNKYSFFNSTHNIFCTNFDCCTTDKLVLIFPQKADIMEKFATKIWAKSEDY